MNRNATKICLLLIVVPSLILAGQAEFEVASVKSTDQCTMQNSMDPGRIAFNGDNLKVLLKEAFRVSMDQIIGPSWLDTDCFVISARMPEGSTKEQLPEMLQALLIARFKLAIHKESRAAPGYALTVAKTGVKFKETDLNSPVAIEHAGQVQFGSGAGTARIKGSITMASLARFLSHDLKGPVQDLTGLQGKYDIDIAWVKNQAGADLPDAPSATLFSAVRESGLRLEARKEQVEVVVVDHIEKLPTEN